jgi:iron(III) transport system substrate-binding protein
MIASDGSWCGVAATARVLIVNTEMLSEREDWPTSVRDLADPEWSDRCAMASPLSGTTATHVAVLKAVQGTEATLEFLEAVAANAAILPDNAAVAKAVAEGEYAWGLTDSDQAVIAQDRRWPVEVTFPDQQPDQPGALRIPSTVAVLAGAPHPVAAGQLADYLVSAETEDRLAMGPRSQLPISRQSEYRPRVLPRQPVRWMDVDFEAAAEGWPAWIETLAARLSAEVD